jgi:uncharacterized protein YndB with AHSA1/START domain
MNPTDVAPHSPSDAVTLEFELPHPPEKVWRALTEPALVSEWLLPVVGLELVPGAAFSFRTDPHPGWDGRVECRMLEVEPPRRLRYAWAVGGAMGLDTVVTFTLAPSAGGTRLTLVQSGFTAAQKRNLAGARYGWKMMSGRLVDVLGRMP